MDAYLAAKFFHVACAVVWLGGGFGLVVLGIVAGRARNAHDFLTVMRFVTLLAPRLFIPGSLFVLASGLIMVWVGDLPLDAWIVIGLAGIAVTSCLGAFLLGPLAGRVTTLVADTARQDEAVAIGRRLMVWAKFDYVLQFAIVFVMVVKPLWSDLAVMSGLCLVIALAGALLAARPDRTQQAA